MGEEIAFENGQISNFRGILTLTLDQVILHSTHRHASLIDLYLVPTYQISLKSKKLIVDGWVDKHLRPTLLGQLRGIDLKTILTVDANCLTAH